MRIVTLHRAYQRSITGVWIIAGIVDLKVIILRYLIVPKILQLIHAIFSSECAVVSEPTISNCNSSSLLLSSNETCVFVS